MSSTINDYFRSIPEFSIKRKKNVTSPVTRRDSHSKLQILQIQSVAPVVDALDNKKSFFRRRSKRSVESQLRFVPTGALSPAGSLKSSLPKIVLLIL